ncbi:hypothetical protein Q4575_07620 [Psychrosphaera sp. 1_MG-2023]|uniref:DUF6702 family protein n=1 Tax=Psychrosphaera sp. 1_MG-2023 TaxID=3062643 RepID=UPI0026E19254|nr:DUF6702 family protein [Psychrosphaera sp. 1_MG-2023]MDO6719261.1 hypothetical protein [Psychrosphaera sp. 1_MG-2023]
MTYRWFTLIPFLIVLLMSNSAAAHKLKSAFSIVLFNERTGFLEVMHRYSLHDAEEAAQELFKGKSDIIDDPKTQQKFADYIMSNFQIRDENKQPIPLNFVGSQNDAGYFWIYQDYKLTRQYKWIEIKQLALTELWREQMNAVNVENSGQTSTVTFSAGDNWQRVITQVNSKLN